MYSTYTPHALQHGGRAETGSEGGFSLVRQSSKGWATDTPHIRAVLSLPGGGDEQATDIPTNATLYLSASSAYAYPSSYAAM